MPQQDSAMAGQSTSSSSVPTPTEDVNMTDLALEVRDATITETTSDNTTTTTTNTKKPDHLPNELLMKICEQYVLPPHLVSIRPTFASDQDSHSHSHSSCPILCSDHTHIPPIMRVKKCAWDVFTRHQKLSFHGLLTHPSYLNGGRDILYFANLATLETFVATKDALKVCRKVGVKRLAVNGLSAQLIVLDPSDELRRPVLVLAHACRLFGYLSNLYLVYDDQTSEEAHEKAQDRACSLRALKAGIEERFTHAQAFWISFEAAAGVKVENKWAVPKIEWVSENELKRMAPSEMMKFIAKLPKPDVVKEVQVTPFVRRSRTFEDLEAEYPVECLVMRKALESNAKRVRS